MKTILVVPFYHGPIEVPHQNMAVAVIHASPEHGLPILNQTGNLTGGIYNEFGLLVDFDFDGEIIYDCEMNERGKLELRRFMQEYFGLAADDGAQGRVSRSIFDILRIGEVRTILLLIPIALILIWNIGK